MAFAVRSGARRQVARERGFWADAFHELARDTTAMLGLAIVVALMAAALLAPVISPADPTFQFREGLATDGQPLAPSSEFRMGTDTLGRDELSRWLEGARVSLAVGVLGNLLSAVVGVIVGGGAGMAGPHAQTAVMRVVDVILSFPVILLAIVLLAVTQPSVITIVLIVGVSFGAYLSRIVYSQTVSLREREFCLAARLAGVRPPSILLRHIVPHVLPAVLVYSALGVATAIALEAALSYVGVGVQPPQPSWGNMINEGQTYLAAAPWLVIFPGVGILLAMIGFSLLGDGLRDALDPTLERRTAIRAAARL